MRRMFVVSLAIAAVLLVAAVPVGADDGVPFKATASVVSADPEPHPMPAVCGDPTQGLLGQEVVYDGRATHLGRFEMAEIICLNFGALDPPDQPLLYFEVFGTYYAANQDELDFHVDGFVNVLTGEVTDDGMHFIGGSGRFESAYGHAHVVLLRDGAGVLIGQTVDGWISYEASDRRN